MRTFFTLYAMGTSLFIAVELDRITLTSAQRPVSEFILWPVTLIKER